MAELRSIFLLSVALTPYCWAQSDTPVPSTFFGISAEGRQYPGVTFGTFAHQEFAWIQIERSRGNFNFAIFDSYIAAAQKSGLVDPSTNTVNMVMTLADGTPAWAVANQSTCVTKNGFDDCTAPPDNIQDWKDFLTALIQHYNGTTQPHIKYYELWNEFNVAEWWTGTDAQMLALAQAAYPIVHQDPYSILLTPSVAGPAGTTAANSIVNRMTSYLKAGGSQYADGCAFHGYIAEQNGVNPYPMPEQDSTTGCKAFATCYGSVVSRATQMRAVFDQNGLAGKPMYQTEGSWGNNSVTDPDTQVAWLARFYLLQAGLRSTLNLQMNAWFTWALPSFGWGIIESTPTTPTAAGVAYSQVYNWVAGANLSQPCASAPTGTWTCTLTRAGGYMAQAVWNTQGTASYTPGAGYTQYRDLTGATTPIAAGTSVTIGPKPILVEGTAPVCAYSTSLGGQSFGASGGTGTINIATQPGCAWSISGAPSWVSFTGPSSGTGAGSVSYTVSADAGADQTATLTVGGVPFTVGEMSASLAGAVNVGSMAQIASAQGWDTAITLINTGSTAAQARLNFFADPSGGALALPFTFPQTPASSAPLMASTLDETINPNSLLVLDTTGPAAQTVNVGWAQLQAAGAVGGYGVFTNAPNNWEAVVSLETRNAPSYILAFDNTGSIVTGLAIANLSSQASNVNVIIRNDSGAQIGGAQNISLPPLGHKSFFLNTTYSVTAGVRGTIEFDTPSGGQISVLGLRANGPALTTVPVLANVTPGTGSISHVTYDGGWQTTILLVNTGATSTQPTLSFFDNNGNPLPIPMLLPQTGATSMAATLTPTLGAGQSLLYQTNVQSTPNPISGSAQLISTGSVSGFAIFRNVASGQEAVVPLETRTSPSYMLGYDNTNGRVTGLAVANGTAQAANLTVTVRNDQGVVLQTGIVMLAAHGHSAPVLTTAYPSSAGTRGTVEIDGPPGFSALGVFVSPTGNVTTLPVLTYTGTPAATPPPAAASTLTWVSGSSVKLEQIIGDIDYQTQAPTTSRTVTRYNILGNDIGYSFEDNGKVTFLFGDTIGVKANFMAHDPVATSTTTNPEAGLLLNFYTNKNGSPLFVEPPGVDMGGNDVPNSGISLPDGVYLIINTGNDPSLPDSRANVHTLLSKFDETAQTFTTGRTISSMPSGHFIITSPHTSGSNVFLFGVGAYRASDVYLSMTPTSSFSSGVGTQYFAGLVNGQPVWVSPESGAVPVLQDNPLNGPAWPNDSPTVGNLSVVYSASLGLWLMTYDGGRQSPRTTGVYFTYAQQPWGPWSTPQLIFNSARDNGRGVFIHDPAIVPDPPGDGLNGPTIGGNDIYTTVGGIYAPNMIERFTTVNGNMLTIYYTLSTWNPYTVVKMRSQFMIAPAPQ